MQQLYEVDAVKSTVVFITLFEYDAYMNELNIKPCECCGQPCPYPTEPGVWEYTHYFETQMRDHTPNWIRVNVIRDEEGLCLIPVNQEEYFGRDLEEIRDPRIWWPSNVMWREVK